MGAKLHFRYASMNAGKSTQLLQIAYNYGESGRKVLLYTAAIDNRAAVGRIASRLGAHSEAKTFDAQTDFSTLPTEHPDVSCVLIDEAQFLNKRQAQQLHQVAAVGNIPVMCFGLRSDFRGDFFEGAAYLLALAEDIQEIKASCACGRKSTMNMRIDGDGKRVTDGDQVLIGGNNSYRQVCARCFYS